MSDFGKTLVDMNRLEMLKMDLRVDALNRVFQYHPGFPHEKIAAALGFASWHLLQYAHYLEKGLDGPISRKLRMLGGDHSYACYKALLANLDK